MKRQFNLEEYNRLVSEGKTPKVVTRDGRDARIICTDIKARYYPIIAAIASSLSEEEVAFFTTDGFYTRFGASGQDLFFAPEKHEGWVVLKKINGLTYVETICPTEEDAQLLVKSRSEENLIIGHTTWEE